MRILKARKAFGIPPFFFLLSSSLGPSATPSPPWRTSQFGTDWREWMGGSSLGSWETVWTVVKMTRLLFLPEQRPLPHLWLICAELSQKVLEALKCSELRLISSLSVKNEQLTLLLLTSWSWAKSPSMCVWPIAGVILFFFFKAVTLHQGGLAASTSTPPSHLSFFAPAFCYVLCFFSAATAWHAGSILDLGLL